MSFLKNIFKKKPGGTMFGNLTRGVGSMLAPGILGSGSGRIEHGQTKTNAALANAPVTGYASGTGSTSSPIPIPEVTVTPSRDIGFKDHTLAGRFLNSFRGELAQASADIQPKVGISDSTMIIGGLALMGAMYFYSQKR